MPVYQQNYKIPTHSDNEFYHSKYWEEFTPYDKPITGCKVKAILINCSDSLVTFDDKKNAGTFVRLPERSELNPEINEALIVEYYNR